MDEQWEDYPDFDAEPENQGKIGEGYWWKCIFCGWDREFNKQCSHCKDEKSGKTIKGLNASDVCKCGHIRKDHCRPEPGRRTGKEFSVCMKCLGMSENCIRFDGQKVA